MSPPPAASIACREVVDRSRSRSTRRVRKIHRTPHRAFGRPGGADDRPTVGLASRHARLLASLGLETAGVLPPAEDLLHAMQMDKKFRGGMRFVLLDDVGRPLVVNSVPEDLLRKTLEEMA